MISKPYIFILVVFGILSVILYPFLVESFPTQLGIYIIDQDH